MYSGMYNNGHASFPQYISEWDPTKTTKKYYSSVGLSTQKIYAEQYQKLGFLLVALVVTNLNICQYSALMYGAYRQRACYIPNMDKICIIFSNLDGWASILIPK